tara:strand:+ start:38 stop:1021 length:984 start_codon:yes stop_codon:yes gene_type:complete
MIISKTPYRISFFGGGSDYPNWYKKYGGEVISSTIDKYVYISCRELPKFFDHSYRIAYSKVEEVKSINEIKHKVVKEVLRNKKVKKHLEIHYDGDLPSKSGVGSSSSFIVGMLNTINRLHGIKKKNVDLANESINFEQKILKETVGSQDQVSTAIGGFNNIKFFKNNNFQCKKIGKETFYKELNKNLVLLFTRKQRISSNIAKKFVKSISTTKKKDILEILNCTKIAKKIIKNNDVHEFGRLMDYSWSIKKNLHKDISNEYLNEVYNQARQSGALGGKILGAGGGGFYLFYVPYEKRSFFLKKMNNFTTIPFLFENKGTQIIFDSSK